MQRHCVSAVVPVRHDNWGGGLALRAQTTLPHLAAAFDELLLVDFNSQNGSLLSTLALLLSVGGVFALSAAAANLYEADGVHFQRASAWYGGVASAALKRVCGSASL